MTTSDEIERAASFIANADALLICAGAGMGVDSGLPDFRGEGGFWTVYPALGRERIEFENIANPNAFRADPIQAWGFYGHRLKLYRETTPHDGFRILKEIAEKLPHGAFVFTSNVDGHFRKAALWKAGCTNAMALSTTCNAWFAAIVMPGQQYHSSQKWTKNIAA